MNYPKAPTVQSSFDYDSFSFVDWNRDLNKKNISVLIQENKRNFQLHKFPILVDSKNRIVDGQHRFVASRTLGAPVYFIRDTSSSGTLEEITSVNRAGKRHSIKDIFLMRLGSGDHSAQKLYDLYNDFGGAFDLSIIISMVVNPDNHNGQAIESLRSGAGLPLGNIRKLREVLLALHASRLECRNTARAIAALSMLAHRNNVSPKLIIERIEKNIIKWEHPFSREETIKSMINCYNYRLKTGLLVKNNK